MLPFFHTDAVKRYCSEKSKDPAPIGTGNSGVVNFAAEIILNTVFFIHLIK